MTSNDPPTRTAESTEAPDAEPTESPDGDARTDGQEGNSTEVSVDGASDEGLPPDVVFHTLKNSRRRHVLSYLTENGGSSELSDLAEYIAAIENDIPKSQLTSGQRKRVYVGLYQCHLPKMDDVGVIEYNQARGTVELTDRIQYFEEYLGTSEESDDRRWEYYYAGIAGVGLAALAGAAVAPLPGLAVTAVTLATMGAVLACSACHWWAERAAET